MVIFRFKMFFVFHKCYGAIFLSQKARREKNIVHSESPPFNLVLTTRAPSHWPLSRQHCEFTKTLLVPKRSKLVVQCKPWSVSGTAGVMLTAPTSSDLFEIPLLFVVVEPGAAG